MITGMPELIELVLESGRPVEDRAMMLGLVCLTRTGPVLRAVWLEAHRGGRADVRGGAGPAQRNGHATRPPSCTRR
jgi:hypothetical protein